MDRLRILFLKGVAPVLALVLACVGFETASQNIMGWLLAVVGVGYMAGGLIYFQYYPDNGLINREEKGDRSFWLILPGFIAVFFGPPLEALYLPEVLPDGEEMQVGGIALIGSGVALRTWARLALRGLYTSHVQVSTGHYLVRNGPYHYMRHPGYAGFVLMALGLCVGYASVVGLVGLTFLLLPALVYRMRVEEGLLVQEFGDAYRDYARTTRRLIPGIL